MNFECIYMYVKSFLVNAKKKKNVCPTAPAGPKGRGEGGPQKGT